MQRREVVDVLRELRRHRRRCVPPPPVARVGGVLAAARAIQLIYCRAFTVDSIDLINRIRLAFR